MVKQKRSLAIPEKDIIHIAVKSLGLDELSKFNPNERIIEYLIEANNNPLAKMTIEDFANETSSESPAPGGGSIAAYCGVLGSALATSETPKVKLVGNVTDLAGNTNKSGNVANAVDRIKPTLTLALSGGSGTGSSPDDSIGLTKKAMTFTITTSEVLSGVPTISIFAEDYGTGSTYAAIGDGDGSAVVDASASVNNGNITVATGAEVLNLDAALAAGGTSTMEITADAVLDSDRDGSLTDEVTLGASGDAFSVTSQQLTDLSVTAVTNQSDSTVDITVTLAAGATTIPEDRTIKVSANHLAAAAGNASTSTIAEGTVTAVAVDATSYTATFDGSLAGYSDASAKDSKATL